MSQIKILIVDDHTLMRQGLRQLCEGLGGFTDGVWSCPWYEYAAMQIFYFGVFAIPFALTFFSGWLVTMGFWFQRRRTSIPDRLPLWQVMLIPMFGCIGGANLVSALPLAINIYYRFFH